MNLKVKKILLTTCVFFTGVLVSAQPGFDPNVDDVAPLPGIILLVLVALGIGVFRLKSE